MPIVIGLIINNLNLGFNKLYFKFNKMYQLVTYYIVISCGKYIFLVSEVFEILFKYY